MRLALAGMPWSRQFYHYAVRDWLDKRMFEDMQLRNLAPKTQSNDIHYISGLAKFYMTSPEHLGFEEIRDDQLYLINESLFPPNP